MILDLNNQVDKAKADTYFAKLTEKGAKIELKEIHKRRTLSQNRYVHVLFTVWSAHFGYSLEEGKIVVKTELGYIHEKNGYVFPDKTSKMNSKKLTTFIDKFRNWSASEGLYLASSDEVGQNWDYFAKEMERAEILENRYSY